MYNFRVLKKFTAVILSGVIFISSTSANAWESKNPIDEVLSDPVYKKGYNIGADSCKQYYESKPFF